MREIINMLVKEIMCKSVVITEPDQPIEEAASEMVDNHIGCLVVVRNETVVGIVTERDILRYVGTQSQVGDKTVADIMTGYVFTVSPHQRLESAISLMRKHSIKKLPVMEGRKLVGIITATDIMIHTPSLIRKLKSLLKGNLSESET